MDLTEEQKAQVAQWVRDGATLQEVQRRLDEELGVKLTFMDVRFLVDDLDLELAEQGPKLDADLNANKAAPDDEPVPFPGAAGEPQPAELDGGQVNVTVDKLQRPGSMVSGEVTFSDGEKMGWQVDQMGRLGLIPQREGYQPSEKDIMEFQSQLESELRKQGF